MTRVLRLAMSALLLGAALMLGAMLLAGCSLPWAAAPAKGGATSASEAAGSTMSASEATGGAPSEPGTSSSAASEASADGNAADSASGSSPSETGSGTPPASPPTESGGSTTPPSEGTPTGSAGGSTAQPPATPASGPLPYPTRTATIAQVPADTKLASGRTLSSILGTDDVWRDGGLTYHDAQHQLYAYTYPPSDLFRSRVVFSLDVLDSTNLATTVWPAPYPLPALRITGIADNGRTVEVRAAGGITGTLALPSGQWHFSGLPASLPTPLRTIRFAGTEALWAQDDLGHVLHSTDGGTRWRDVTPPAMSGLKVMASDGWSQGKPCCSLDVFPGDPDRAASVNLATGDVYLTGNAGRTWTKAGVPTVGVKHLADAYVDMVNDTLGWLSYRGGPKAENGALLQTTDGGRNWSFVTSDSPSLPPDQRLPAGGPVMFQDAQHGWLSAWFAGGYGPELYRTTDGGRSWAHVDLPGGSGTAPRTVRQPPLPTGDGGLVVQTQNGPAFLSEDGGTTWKQLQPDGLSHFRFVGDGHGYAVQRAAGQQAVLLQTTDGGRSWTAVDGTLPGDAAQLAFADDDHGWVRLAGSQHLFVTQDGGASWTEIQPQLLVR